MRDILKDFGTVVRKKRHQLGVSQEKFALQANIDRTYMSDIERGLVNVGLVNAQKIAKALGVSLGRLVTQAEKWK